MFQEAAVLADNEVVVVKFGFSNPKVIPAGLRSVERKGERELLERRRAQGTGPGVQVVNNTQQVQVAMLRRGLAANGFLLVDVHVYELRRPNRKTKYMVSLSFRRVAKNEEIIEIAPETLDGLRRLATEAVWSGHIWQNPNGVVCVDLVQRQPGVAPKNAFVTREGALGVEAVTALVEEGQE